MATGLMPEHGSVLRNCDAPRSPTNVESASRMATAWFLYTRSHAVQQPGASERKSSPVMT